jgi:hypothetical protein
MTTDSPRGSAEHDLGTFSSPILILFARFATTQRGGTITMTDTTHRLASQSAVRYPHNPTSRRQMALDFSGKARLG